MIFTAIFAKLFAQTDTFKLSLNQAIQLGLNSRFDEKANSLNIEIYENKRLKSIKELLPDIYVGGKVIYNGKVQPTIVSPGILGFTEPEKVALGMKNNTSLSLDFDYTIYKPGLYTDAKIAENNLDLEKEKKIKSDIDIKIEIAEAYDDALLKLLQYDIAQKNENRYEEYYNLADGKYKNGTLLESDILLAELDYKNAIANTEKQKQNYELSIHNMKYKLNIPLQSEIILTDSLQSFVENNLSENRSNNSTSNRSEIKQLTIRQVGYELQLKKIKENFLPTVSLFANYTQLFQGMGFDYGNSFYWAPVNYVGVKFSIPIMGNIKNINSIKEFNLKLVQNDLELKQKIADIRYEVQESLTKLNNAKKNMRVAKDNFELSQKVYELKKQQYNLGSFSYEKLLDTEKSLSATEQDYIIAVYNFLIAKISYRKATGNF